MTPPAPPATPPDGGAAEIAPGMVWVRMPLPYALDHVNLWLLDEGDGWTVVDTGHGDEATRAAWEAAAGTMLRGRPIRRVLCTHHHPDHIGLAGWMAERWGAELWCTCEEWVQARTQTLDSIERRRTGARDLYRRAGVPEEMLPRIVEKCRSYPENVTPVPERFRRLRDGDVVVAGDTRWRVVVGRGHAPEHACLFSAERALFVSGDQILPHITPNVSVWPDDPDGDPLGAYLASLPVMRRVPAEVLVLPSHGRPFTGLHRRCDELVRHHAERLELTLAACEAPCTAHDVMNALFARDLDPHQTTFAIGEAIAHLNRLVGLGLVRRERREGRPDRYVRVASEVRPARAACEP